MDVYLFQMKFLLDCNLMLSADLIVDIHYLEFSENVVHIEFHSDLVFR